MSAAVLGMGAIPNVPTESGVVCPEPAVLLREAHTVVRMAAVYVRDGRPQIARALLQASSRRLAECGGRATAGAACPGRLGRARDDVALAFSLLARRQEIPLRDVLERASASLLVHADTPGAEHRLELRELRGRLAAAAAAPHGTLGPRDLLDWWDRLELWCWEAAVDARASASAARSDAP